MIPTFINRTCQIVTRTATGTLDDYGNQTASEASVDTVCEVQPRKAIEPDAELSDEDWVGFFLPADEASLKSASRVEVPGLGNFELVGKGLPWRNPRTQTTEYVQANLRHTGSSEDA